VFLLFSGKNTEFFDEISSESSNVTLSYFSHIDQLTNNQPHCNKNSLAKSNHLTAGQNATIRNLYATKPTC
jgi:hypothetical protein